MTTSLLRQAHRRLIQNHRYFSTAMSKRSRAESPQVEWSKRPPYAPEDGNDKREVKYQGSCHCGDVSFNVYTEEVMDARFCHCDVCHKLHGAPAHWSVTMKKPDVLFTNDADKFCFYRTEDKSNNYELPVKVTCKRCHAPICDEGRNMMMMYPSLINFPKNAHKENFLPKQHIFYSMRSVDVHDDKPKWSKMQDESELMDEAKEHGKKGTAGGEGKSKTEDS